MDSQEVRFYLSIFLRRLHYFLPPLVLVTLAGCTIALLLPREYLAVSRILVESSRISADLARPSVPADGIRQLQVLEQQLTTRASMLAMAEKFAIYSSSDLSTDDIVDDMRGRTRVEPVELGSSGSGAISFAISFQARDPILAAEVANAFVGAILERNAHERNARATDALEFFRRDVGRLEQALDRAQDAILGFKQKHRDALPDSLEFRRMQQHTGEERLQQLQREEISYRERRSTIERILATPASGRALSSDGQMLTDLRRVLAEQQTVFSEESPNLVMLRSRIAGLEKRIAEIRAGKMDIAERDDISPELRVQFAEIDGQLAFIAQEKEAVRSALAGLARSIAETEMNSTMLAALEQDYETAQTQYNDAVAKLAEASTGQRIESEAIGEKLTLIEPATPPERPIWPKRRAIAAGSLAAGIALGLGLVVLVEFWAPSIRRPVDLASVFEGQPFVTIPYIPAGDETLMRRLGAALLLLGALGSLPGATLVRGQADLSAGAPASTISTQADTTLATWDNG